MRTQTLAALAVASFVPALCAQGALGAPCFVTQFGTNLNLSDDSVSQNALPFTFPGPAGPVTTISVSSNGFVWLGSNSNSECCNGYLPSFLTSMARIAPIWMDLNPSQAGAVWFNTFPASGSQPASAVVTWDGVPEFSETAPMTTQLQLFADGSFTFLYDSACYNLWHTMLNGVTQGGAAVANPVDFSGITGATPHISGTNPTVEEEQTQVFDVAGRSFAFIPSGTGGYIVLDRPGCTLANTLTYGHGCPSPSAGYEFFPNYPTPTPIDLSNIAIDFTPTGGGGYVAIPGTGFFTGYTNSQVFGDDQVRGPYALGFTFPFPGGSTSAIDISSNGFIWMQTGNSDSRCCSGYPAGFLADPASIAALWMDLYPPGGGNIYFDTTPGEAHITWAGVPEYFNGPPQTAQITLRSNGTWRLAYGTVNNSNHDVLVGYSQGNVLVDPGSHDFSAGPVIISGSGAPMALRSQPGSRPALGTTYTMDIDQSTNGALIGVMLFGGTGFDPGIDLTVLGMPGCELYATLDVMLTVVLPGPVTPFSIGIPNVPALAGSILFSEAAALVPTANPLGLATSNGIKLTVGV